MAPTSAVTPSLFATAAEAQAPHPPGPLPQPVSPARKGLGWLGPPPSPPFRWLRSKVRGRRPALAGRRRQGRRQLGSAHPITASPAAPARPGRIGIRRCSWVGTREIRACRSCRRGSRASRARRLPHHPLGLASAAPYGPNGGYVDNAARPTDVMQWQWVDHTRAGRIESPDAAAHSQWRRPIAQMAERFCQGTSARPPLLPPLPDHHLPPPQYRSGFARPRSSSLPQLRPDSSAPPEPPPIEKRPRRIAPGRRPRRPGSVRPVPQLRHRQLPPRTGPFRPPLPARPAATPAGIAAEQGPTAGPPSRGLGRRGGGGASLLQGGQVVKPAPGRCRFRMGAELSLGLQAWELGQQGPWESPSGPTRRTCQPLQFR